MAGGSICTLMSEKDDEDSSKFQIALYRYDAARCLAEVDGESVSLVERTAVVDLIEAVHGIVLS